MEIPQLSRISLVFDRARPVLQDTQFILEDHRDQLNSITSYIALMHRILGRRVAPTGSC